jgi:hypothetical protein
MSTSEFLWKEVLIARFQPGCKAKYPSITIISFPQPSFSAKATIWFCDQAACSYHVDVEAAEALYFRDMQCQKRWRRSARTFMIVGDAIIRSVGTRAKRKRRVIAHLKGSSIRILADAQALPWLNKTDSRAPIKLRCVELQSGPRSREAHGPLYCK